MIAFEGGNQPGWHSLQVRVRKGRVNARRATAISFNKPGLPPVSAKLRRGPPSA